MKNSNASEGISVIMPTYNQSAFIKCAIRSLLIQTFTEWELIIVNDGSTDDTKEAIQEFVGDSRLSYYELNSNRGLGFAINYGLKHAQYNLIAYLPSDDVFFQSHLTSLYNLLMSEEAVLALSGVVHHRNNPSTSTYGMVSEGQIPGYPIQLVQVMHWKTPDLWIEREELVTDDYTKMYWEKLLYRGDGVGSGEATCEWVDHSHQRHKIIRDTWGGGIYFYKYYYKVKFPIRFKSIVGNFIDEVEYYKPFNNLKKKEVNGLKILLVGELAYNAERILAFEQRGHKLYGLWITRPKNYNVIGPLPFGNIEDIPIEGWQESVRAIAPDIIYALLNYESIPLAHLVLTEKLNIPFVYHFKEGPIYARFNGTWNKLIDLFSKSDGQIYINELVRTWFSNFLPKREYDSSFILDGDLPKEEWFSDERVDLLSGIDGEVHTVCAGRPLGMTIDHIKYLGESRIHIHFYGDVFQSQFEDFITEARTVSPGYVHTHPNCPQKDWVKEFSKYDAGWLHLFSSDNEGEILKTTWYDQNYPARLSTYAIAGVPMILNDNTGHLVASESLLRKLDMGVFVSDFSGLHSLLSNRNRMAELRDNAWKNRKEFCFDFHVDKLISFFQSIIRRHKKHGLLN